MKEEDKNNTEVYAKFCGENAKITAGKACENCSCGRKE